MFGTSAQWCDDKCHSTARKRLARQSKQHKMVLLKHQIALYIHWNERRANMHSYNKFWPSNLTLPILK